MPTESLNLRFRVNQALLSALENEGLDDFAKTMRRQDGVPIKVSIPERQVHRLVLEDGQVYFLKRTFSVPVVQAIRHRLEAGPWHSRPCREWLALQKMKDLGLPAATPVICGERYRWGCVREAFILTQGLRVQASLEEILLADGEFSGRKLDVKLIANQVAGILRAMHEGGVNHRDFYLGHLFLGDDLKTVWVMDLDRADCRREVGLRWRVKDLAALHFSTPTRLFSHRCRLRFLRCYLGESLRGHRDLIQAISAKAEKIRAHVERKVARKEANFHIND